MELKIINKSGEEFIVLYDDSDHETVSKYRWRIVKYKKFIYAAADVKLSVNKWRLLLMHRAILGINSPKVLVDHKNHNTLDNSRENIRQCTSQQNCQNMSSRINSTSSFVGVYFFKRDSKWRAKIRVNGKNTHLGTFAAEHEAAKARDNAAILHYKEFAHLNLKTA